MQALEPRVVAAVWAAVEPLLPARPPDRHPLGCHRPRIADRACFAGILLRLVTGCSWRTAGRLGSVGATTLRGRRTDWLRAGVFERLVGEAIAAYDRIIGLDLSEVALDGSLHKAPCGGEGTGPNPTDRAKCGWKWSIATDWHGIPIGWATAGANRHDALLLGPTLAAVGARGLLADIETVHLDRGYDSAVSRARCAGYGLADVVCAQRRPRGTANGRKRRQPLGLRWPVERTNAWLANFGQLRRNTDRRIAHRPAALALAVVLIITIKLIAWADRWSP